MEIQLLYDNPLNTTLIVDGAPLYAIKSTGFLLNRTEVRRGHRNMAIEDTTPVAVIEWRKMVEKTTVQLAGQTKAWDEILTHSGKWYSQTFSSASSGDTCLWKFTWMGHLSLVNSASETIADYSRSPANLFGPSQKAFITVMQEGIPMLDQLIVTWIIMERKYREREHKQRHGLPP